VAVFENRQLVTAAKFINKSSLFILLLGVIRQLKLKLISELTADCYSVSQPIAKPNVSSSLYRSHISLTGNFLYFIPGRVSTRSLVHMQDTAVLNYSLSIGYSLCIPPM
jgi:hypothetical protein